MSPTTKRTGMMNAEIIYQLVSWAKQDSSGIAFDSNTLFTLPNGAKRSPDASWMLKSRSDAFVADPAEYFDQICPDFVLELWSPSDILKEVHAKMAEYIANGARLGFLLYPPKRRVWVYRPSQEPQCLEQPQTVSGDPELPDFRLNLTEVWQ
jgi:Uma2 family endonuclease